MGRAVWLALLLFLPAMAQLMPAPQAPRVNGLLTVRVDPAAPHLTLDWDAHEVSGASGVDYEISRGPFPNKNPAELSKKPLREGHFSGSKGSQELDVKGLSDGEYFVRYQAVNSGGHPVSLASEPARFVIIAGSGNRNPGAVDPTSSPSPATAPKVSRLRLVPEQVSLPLGSVQKFWLPDAVKATQVASWKVEGQGVGVVDAQGVYRAPEVMPGGPGALTGYLRVVATLSDGRAVEAEVVLLRPPRLLEIVPSGKSVPAGGSLQLRAVIEGTAQAAPAWVLVSGPGSLEPTGLYRAPARVSAPQKVVVRLIWPGLTPGTDIELLVQP